MKKKKTIKHLKPQKKISASRGYFFHIVVGVFAFVAIVSLYQFKTSYATDCTQTGFYRDGINLTAAKINPEQPVTGEVDATGCHIGIYFGPGSRGSLKKANVHGANYFGVVNQKARVDIQDSVITNIGETPFNGTQHGVAVYYATVDALVSGTVCTTGATSGKIDGNIISNYQKGGVVANCTGTQVQITNNKVTGLGPVSFIAQNGIQVGYGADSIVKGNTVENNSYTGTSTVSGGIVVVGGAYYGSDLTKGTQILDNTVRDNDIGIFLTNLGADGAAPTDATNVKAVNNTVSSTALNNHYGGVGYQAGISDVGNNDKIIANTISGAGYDPAANPGAYTVQIDADPSFTNRPKVHAN